MIARALIERDRHILVCTNVKKGYHYLPGGHIEFGESAAAALKREIKEECGLRSVVGDLRAVAEIAFRRKGRLYHEVNLVFHVELRGHRGLAPVRSRETDIAFEWIHRKQFKLADVRPTLIRQWAIRPPKEVAIISDATLLAK